MIVSAVLVNKIKLGKDKDLGDGNFELNYDSLDLPESGVFDSAVKNDLNRIEAKIDSVVNWIRQFYDRFAYLEEEFLGIKDLALENKERIIKLGQGSGPVISDAVFVDNERLELEIGILSQKIEETKSHFKNNLGGGLHNAQMNEISRMNENVISNVERSQDILDRINSIFSEVKRVRSEVEELSPKVQKQEEKIVRSKEAFEKWSRNADLEVGIRGVKKVKKKYKKLVEEEPEPEVFVSYPVGSKEWLREVRKNSK